MLIVVQSVGPSHDHDGGPWNGSFSKVRDVTTGFDFLVKGRVPTNFTIVFLRLLIESTWERSGPVKWTRMAMFSRYGDFSPKVGVFS